MRDAYTFGEMFDAWLPFLLTLALALATSDLVPFVHGPLAALKSSVAVYSGDGAPITFAWILTPGVLILIAVSLSCALQRRRFRELLRIAKEAAVQSLSLAVTIASIVAMAKIMNYSGMTDSIAAILITVFGGAYPLIAPAIGALGTFITGSDTTSGVLFGNLQLGAA
jgi:lactate permease